MNFDKLTYAGNLENLQDFENDKRYAFVQGDICDIQKVREVVQQYGKFDAIINFAAETHVDRSLTCAGSFIQTDIFGAFVLLEAVKDLQIPRFIQISTDEVYGDIDFPKKSKETDKLHPSSPYSASKAGGDLQVLAYQRTYNLPVIITRSTNNYGPYQYPEKLLPLFITNLLEGKKVPLYDQGTQIRDWIYVEDNCKALDLVLHKGVLGEIYNIGAENKPEITNLEITQRLLRIFQKDSKQIEPVNGLRPGHDQRYAVDSAKIRALGWQPEVDFEQGLQITVDWYKNNKKWWQKIKSGEFKEYYQKHYQSK